MGGGGCPFLQGQGKLDPPLSLGEPGYPEDYISEYDFELSQKRRGGSFIRWNSYS